MPENDLPESARKVLNCLLVSPNGLSPTEIISQTSMNRRTVHYALKNLVEKKIVETKPILQDMRKKRYLVRGKFEADIQQIHQLKYAK
ncbi:MAG: helix-turn-helix domain-containing protein [Candidatus Hodarchaeota archaeon]